MFCLWRYPSVAAVMGRVSSRSHHRRRHVGVIWVASPFSLRHYHKSDLRLIDANGSLFFSIINRPLPWPQAVIEAAFFFTHSLKQRARPGTDPKGGGAGGGETLLKGPLPIQYFYNCCVPATQTE